jgi:hypothetical protein
VPKRHSWCLLKPKGPRQRDSYRKKNGLDPLGMQSGSVDIYQRLLPGISNVTLRLRYYGLYAWLSRTYAREIGDTNLTTWQRFIRRAEALYALIAQRKGQETGVAGVDWAARVLGQIDADIVDFAEAAEPGSVDHYLKQPWGAYGAAYGSQLEAIGIFRSADEHSILVPTEKIGNDAADAFAEGLSGLAAPFLAAIHEGKASLAELDTFSPITPSAIPEHSNERTCYENILFSHSGMEGMGDVDRRRSLLLLLAVAKQRGGVPAAADVRWMLYSGYDAGNRPLQLSSEELNAQRWRWWAYQANDLLHICYEGLLKYCLDVLSETPAGISLSRLIGDCTARLMAARDGKSANWKSFRQAYPPPQNCLLPNDKSGELYLQRELMRKTRPDGVCEAPDAFLALRLLAVLHNRVRSSPKDPADELGKLNGSLVHSLLTELRYLEAHENDDFAEFIGRLIEERVVRRHLWVGLRKFRYQGDYTFLIETDDGRVRLRAMDGPVFTNPRLGPALTFLRDIHLINEKGLTPHGERLVAAA